MVAVVFYLLYNKLMHTQPFFSVIIPTFNRVKFLKKAVDSVLGQTFDDLELIVVDDGSTDGTKELISSYTDERIKYLHGTNRGVASSRNRGLFQSKGLFIAFLDSDDYWLNVKLEKIKEHIDSYPEIKVFHTEEIWYRRGELLNQRRKHKKPSGDVYKKALPLCCISISTAVIKKEVFERIGAFDEDFEACEDYDFWLRVTNEYEIKLIPEYLTIKDGGRPDQLSSRIWGLDRFRIKALEKMLSSGKLSSDAYKTTLMELEKKCRVFSLGCEKRGKKREASIYKDLPLKYSVSL